MPPAIAKNPMTDPQIICYIVLGGLLSLYLFAAVARRYLFHLTWPEAFLVTHSNSLVDRANRAFREDKVNNQPKKASMVRFMIDGVILNDETDL